LDTLQKIVLENSDSEEAEVINQKLEKIKSYHESDDDHINRMVTFLEEEEIGTRIIFKWFIEVLEDDDIKYSGKLDDTLRRQLILDIQEKLQKIDPYGPVNKD
jgi:hypothetical protein